MAVGIQESIEEEEKARKQAQQDAIKAAGGTITTPLGGSTTGMNPHQAKMQGTPNQKQGALSQAFQQQETATNVDQDDQLATAIEESKGADIAIDPAAERARAFSDKMASYGSLGQAVEDKIAREFAEKNDPTIVNLDIPESTLKTIAANPEDLTEINTFISDFNALMTSGIEGDEAAAGALLASSQGLFAGTENGENAYSMLDLIKASYPDPVMQKELVANAIAKGIVDANDLSVSEIFDFGENIPTDPNTPMEEFGGLSVSDMVEMVGEDWHTMSIGEISAKLEDQREDVLGQAQEIEKQLKNPQLPPAVRESLMAQYAKLGATGILDSEADAKRVVDDVSKSGMVKFNGEMVSVEELLDDDNIKEAVGGFLMLDPEADAAEIAKMKEENPEFTGWLESTFANVSEGVEDIGEMIETVKTTSQSNDEVILANTSEMGFDESLGPKMMEALGHVAGSWAAEGIDLESSEFFQALTANPEDLDANIIGRLNGMSVGMMEDLAGITEPELTQALKYLGGDNYEYVNNWDTTRDAVEKATGGSVDEVITAAWPGSNGIVAKYGTIATIKTRMKRLKTRAAFDPTAKKELEELEGLFGAGGNATAAQVQQNILNSMGDGGIESLLGDTGNSFLAASKSTPTADDPSGVRNAVFKIIEDGGGTDSVLLQFGNNDINNWGALQEIIDMSRTSSGRAALDAAGIDVNAIENQQKEQTRIELERVKAEHAGNAAGPAPSKGRPAAETRDWLSKDHSHKYNLVAEAKASGVHPSVIAILQRQADAAAEARTKWELNHNPLDLNSNFGGDGMTSVSGIKSY